VLKFSPEGELLMTIGNFLPDDLANVNGFSGPEGVAVDSDGNVYGAEVSQRRMTKWVRFRR
jgi:hypothetical protein